MIPSPQRFNVTALKICLFQTNLLPCFLLLCIGLCSIMGCWQPGPSATEAKSLPSPEADLEWVIERLQRAISIRPSAAQSGLRIKRELSYEYKAPDSSNTIPAAVVKIKTLTIFQHSSLAPSNTETPKEQKKDSTKPSLNLVDPLAGSDLDNLDDFTNVDPNDKVIKKILEKPHSIDVQVPARRMEESKTFKLIYQQDRWQLEKQPEKELEQGWFKYALPN